MLQDGISNMHRSRKLSIVEQRNQGTKEFNKKRYLFQYDTGHHPMTLFDQKESGNVLWQHFIFLHLIIII